ncbi:MAG TPA: carboxypeptidase regulatory-like domain-containing protein [Xanthobacteraceae bacterium]|nr:carboxypeptidase regulatory-like domain-containing protein [Xanthobacteraceae bacterium]
MDMRRTLLASAAALATIVCSAAIANAQSALTGQVSSAEEGNMEGVVVTAKKDGSTIAISVVTDAQGRFAFPANRLDAGKYTIKARAAGYELPGANNAEVTAGQEAKAQLKMTKVKNLANALTNAEWLASMPGTDEQKKFLLNCTGCHTLDRIVKSSHNADEFLDIFGRMGTYYPGSTPMHPQKLVDFVRDRDRGNARPVAEWLSTINLSQRDTWNYELKTLPRLTGKSTKVVITEYDLPETRIQPHDVMMDRAGNVWYSDFGQMFLGKMDATTGKVTQYPIPVVKPGYSQGTLNLEIDADDNPWVGVMYQSAIAKFDKKTEKFTMWQTPKEWDTSGGQLGHLAVTGTPTDNKVWIKNSDGTNIYRLDLTTNKFENFGAPKDPRTGRRIGTYGIHSDTENNAYLLDFSAGNIVKIDAKTKQETVFLTPTPNSTPRRGRVDSEGRLWFAAYRGMAIGMLDPKEGKIKEWKVPSPWSSPYDAMAGKDGSAWTGSMLNDRVSRLDVKSGEYIEYQLPRPTNIRRVYIDDRTNPGALWVGSNHNGTIVKVEPILN